MLKLTRTEWATTDWKAWHILVADIAEAKIMCKDSVVGEQKDALKPDHYGPKPC